MVKWTLARAVAAGGLLGGALDLAYAVLFAAYNGTAAGRVLQSVASGILGSSAFTGGHGAAALGLACHFVLSVLWATLFAAAVRRLPALASRPLATAAGFGLVVFLCMRLIVLPLSAYPFPVGFKPVPTALDLLSHMVLFAVPIVVIVGHVITVQPTSRSR